MTYTLSIDPSVNCLGWALWLGTQLVDCGMSRKADGRMSLDKVCELHYDAIRQALARHGHPQFDPLRISAVWVEQMSLGGERDRGAIAKANDLLAVQAVGAYVAGKFGRLRYAPVNTWKGTASKKITEARARNVLTPTEVELVDRAAIPASLAHNVWDSVGIGLFAVGRYVVRGGSRVA